MLPLHKAALWHAIFIIIYSEIPTTNAGGPPGQQVSGPSTAKKTLTFGTSEGPLTPTKITTEKPREASSEKVGTNEAVLGKESSHDTKGDTEDKD